MRIGVDYGAALWQGAGIGRYTRGLIEALLRIDREDRYVLLYPRGLPGRPAPFLGQLRQLRADNPHVRLCPLPLSDRWLAILWQRLRLPLPVEAVCGRVDLFFSPDFVLPPQLTGRRVVVVHDLAFLVHPECAVPSLEWYLQGAVPRAIARADLVLADSESCRHDLIHLLNVDPARVEVLYSGVEPAFHPLQEQDQLDTVRARYGLPERFLLTVGTIEPRKNLPRLFEALARIPQDLRLPVVVVGKQGWLHEDSFAAVEKQGLQSWVHFLGFVPQQDVPALYNLALALTYPSLYEGFGLPPLEAMACGTPVLTSDVASLPEVVGKAAILVDPKDVDSIAEGLQRLLADAALRAELRAAGLIRAREFTWERAARRLLELIGGLMS